MSYQSFYLFIWLNNLFFMSGACIKIYISNTVYQLLTIKTEIWHFFLLLTSWNNIVYFDSIKSIFESGVVCEKSIIHKNRTLWIICENDFAFLRFMLDMNIKFSFDINAVYIKDNVLRNPLILPRKYFFLRISNIIILFNV